MPNFDCESFPEFENSDLMGVESITGDRVSDWLLSFEEFKGVNKDCVDLISKMLQLDPVNRITLSEALTHVSRFFYFVSLFLM